VCVSSILPPNCKVITKEKGLQELSPGEVVHCVLARNETNENNRLTVASIGCAVPTDLMTQYGYLSEHHSFGETDEQAGEYAEDLAASMLATTLGVEFDAAKSWDEREQIYKMSGKIVRTRNITQSAEGKTGLWITVVAAAVFIEEDEQKQPLSSNQQQSIQKNSQINHQNSNQVTTQIPVDSTSPDSSLISK